MKNIDEQRTRSLAIQIDSMQQSKVKCQQPLIKSNSFKSSMLTSVYQGFPSYALVRTQAYLACKRLVSWHDWECFRNDGMGGRLRYI